MDYQLVHCYQTGCGIKYIVGKGNEGKAGKGKVHPCTSIEALYRPYGL
jgi:hypothetical protein